MTTKRSEPESDNSIPCRQEAEPSTKKEKKNDDDGTCASVGNEEKMKDDTNSTATEQQRIILFYKYHRLSPCEEKMECFRLALEKLCRSLELTGRILIGCSYNEGINGTLAGRKEKVRAFTYALLGRDFIEQKINLPSNNNKKEDNVNTLEENLLPILEVFWRENEQFAHSINSTPLTMASPDDFKWSKSTSEQPLFPDLNIKLVKEIIGTGGCLESIPLDETSQGYLTPKEWHNQLKGLSSSQHDSETKKSQDTVLIDCRNTKECSIGTFPDAIDPGTTTFSQFPLWVQNNRHRLAGKKVMMYCTGGIRCEKASAYIRSTVDGVQSVNHLKGGIHKYLEEYGNEGLWKGKNFVFDGRGAADAIETKLGKDDNNLTKMDNGESSNTHEIDNIVGRCLYCDCPYDTFDPGCVCTVCREPTLVCTACRSDKSEFHCKSHSHLRSCYFTNLIPFTAGELQQQLEELDSHLDSIRVGRKFKQKRKTLQKQYNKIQERLVLLRNPDGKNNSVGQEIQKSTFCRNCGDAECSGLCWGFHGLKRKEALEKASALAGTTTKENDQTGKGKKQRPNRQKSNQRISKQIERERMLEEIRRLRLSLPPSKYRNAESGVRLPPPCTRVIQTTAKGKWCGKPIRHVLQNEFATLSDNKTFDDLVELGLLRVNGIPLTEETASQEIKNMDVISRIVHWHEPPVVVGAEIPVHKIQIPATVLEEYHIEPSSPTSSDDDLAIYVCNKPATLPVHPAGPYLANTLTMMVEAQDKLEPRSLTPCHRIDRVTSGLTLCCTNVGIARLIQSKIDEGSVKKLYLAKVQGNFIASEEDSANTGLPENSEFARWSWPKDRNCVQVDAPVHTLDAQNGIRVVSSKGKPSRSRFQFLAYDQKTNTSLIACCPLTGRGHQLRVHLQWLGFSIANDEQYGGMPPSECTYNTKEILAQMVESSKLESSGDESAENTVISHSDIQAAKTACRCCQDGENGFRESFTPAQLLERGHSICLHALRYQIPIFRKKKKHTDADKQLAPLATIEAEVALPDWAEYFGPIGPLPCLH